MRDIGPELRPNDYKNDKVHEDNGGVIENKDKEPTALEDLGNWRNLFQSLLLNILFIIEEYLQFNKLTSIVFSVLKST